VHVGNPTSPRHNGESAASLAQIIRSRLCPQRAESRAQIPELFMLGRP
jgi:hypothetical protein